jgi:hypothetical protein
MRHSGVSLGNWETAMRGADMQQGGMFSYVSLEARVPTEHPLRAMRVLLDEALGKRPVIPSCGLAPFPWTVSGLGLKRRVAKTSSSRS